MSAADLTALPGIAAQLRGMIIDMSHAAGTPHLGSSLSCVDISTAAYWDALRIDPARPDDPGRDRFILSKGHAATALYATLAERGFFPRGAARDLQQGRQPARRASRPELRARRRGGDRLARPRPADRHSAWRSPARIQGRDYRVYRAAERRRVQRGLGLGGGDVRRRPEARERLRHRRLQQVAGHRPQQRDAGAGAAARRSGRRSAGTRTRSTATTSARWRRCCASVPNGSGKPVAIIAHTVKGKGVSFMEDDNNWHYRIPNAEGSCRRQARSSAWHEKRLRRRDRPSWPTPTSASSCCPATSATSCSTSFKAAHPDRFFNCGVAEANMMGMAAGMAMCGLRPVTYTITPFTTTRCLEQIRVDVCYHDVPVDHRRRRRRPVLCRARRRRTIRCEDIAFLRALPGMSGVCPGRRARGARRRCARRCGTTGPAYIRMGKKGEPLVHRDGRRFRDRPQAITSRDGVDVCLLATGNMLPGRAGGRRVARQARHLGARRQLPHASSRSTRRC